MCCITISCGVCAGQVATKACHPCGDTYCDTCFRHVHVALVPPHSFECLVAHCQACGMHAARWLCWDCNPMAGLALCKHCWPGVHSSPESHAMALPGQSAPMETLVLRSRTKTLVDELVAVRLARALRARERRRLAAEKAAAVAAAATQVIFRFLRRVLLRKHLQARLERRRLKAASRPQWWRMDMKVPVAWCAQWCLEDGAGGGGGGWGEGRPGRGHVCGSTALMCVDDWSGKCARRTILSLTLT